jgi:hypothetical protein
MLTIPRRQFLIGSALPALVGVKARAEPVVIVAEDGAVQLRSDGLALSPPNYARLLARLADDPGIEADEYSRYGVVASLEARFAAFSRSQGSCSLRAISFQMRKGRQVALATPLCL